MKITAEYRRSALRRGIVVKANKQTSVAPQITMAAAMEMLNLGFMVNPESLEGMSEAALTAMIGDARNVIGADRNMTPIYPGFPQQVEDLDTLTLLWEQILHYWTGGAFLPNYPTIVREGLPLVDMLKNVRKVQVLSAAVTARELTRKLVTSPVALSDDDKVLLQGSIELQMPTLDEIQAVTAASRNGENMQSFLRVVAEVGSYSTNQLVSAVAPSCDNPDQLLRSLLTVASQPAADRWAANYKLAVENLSNSNARAVRMKNISRPARRVVLGRLSEVTTGYKADALVSRQNLWRGAMKAVHPYDFKLDEPQKRAVDIIHSNVDYRTLNSHIEESMETGDVLTAVDLMLENKPGELLRRIVALLRLVSRDHEAKILGQAVAVAGAKSKLTTLISAYNGVLSANDETARVTKVAGRTNTMVDRTEIKKVSDKHLKIMVASLEEALLEVLKGKAAPEGKVAVSSKVAVPLVRRDAATADRVLDRGEIMATDGEGSVLRLFGHWRNNQKCNGYMDIGAVLLDEQFAQLAVSTWDTHTMHREWSTYSGDCNVPVGGEAAEYFDVYPAKARKAFPKAKWAVLTVQSYSGWPINTVDFIAGAMFRSDNKKGEVFDARSVVTAFKPTTISLQSVPLAVNLETGEMVWLDASSGSTAMHLSSSRDDSIGTLVYDEVARPRLTMGELATMWALAHDAETVDEDVDREKILSLLG